MMPKDEFMAIETARYIGLGMDLQAARTLANADWGWARGRTHDMRVAEARERLKFRHKSAGQREAEDMDREYYDEGWTMTRRGWK